MGIWTLDCNGTEKTFPDWGICADSSIELVSKGKWTATLRTTEAFDTPAASLQFAWKNAITIWQNRSAVGSGGSIYFYGWVAEIKTFAEGVRQGVEYTCHDIWWLLERQPFKQVRNTVGSVTEGVISYGTPAFLSEIYLGESVSLTGFVTGYLTNGQQIAEILNWLNECNNPTRQGNAYDGHSSSVDPTQDIVDFQGRADGVANADIIANDWIMDPAINIPITRVQTIYCHEAVVNMLRWSPSVIVQRSFQASGVRTALNFIDQLGPHAPSLVSLTLTEAQERNIRSAPDYSRQLPGVIIHYKKVQSVNGAATLQTENDIWPDTCTEFTPEALCLFVELAGGNLSIAQANILVTPVLNATAGSPPGAQLSFWAEYEHLLANNPNISTVSFDNSTFTAQAPGSTTAIDLTAYPNVLMPKTPIPKWMVDNLGIVVTDAVLSIAVSYSQIHAPTGRVNTSIKRYIHARVKLTNAQSMLYSAVTHSDPGEPFPSNRNTSAGLAAQIYNSLAPLTHSGRITILEGQLAGTDLANLQPGAPLQLIGPNNTYGGGGANGNLFIQSARVVPHDGSVEIDFGPRAVLDAHDVIELARCTSWRRVYDMPSGRGTAQPGDAPTDDITGDNPVENTTHPPGDLNYDAAVIQSS